MKRFRYRFILRCRLEQEYIFNATFFLYFTMIYHIRQSESMFCTGRLRSSCWEAGTNPVLP